MTQFLEQARDIYNSGINVLPAKLAHKRPVGQWKRWTQERGQFEELFVNGVVNDAVCVVCGKISNGLEILDFDQQGKVFDAWRDCFATAPAVFFDKLVIERSQSGGYHVAYRCAEVEGNKKLAKDSNGVLIETRGEGGICLVAPSPKYELIQGDWAHVQEIETWERNLLFEFCKSFDETEKDKQKSVSSLAQSPQKQYEGETVADYVKRLCLGKESLRRAGWEYLRSEGDYEYWKRPGQTVPDKTGGSWNTKDNYFHVFSSNASPFEEGGTYSNLQVIALLEFGGNVSEASKHYAKLMGSRSARPIVVQVGDTEDSFVAIEERGTVHAPKKTSAEDVPFPTCLYDHDGLISEIREVINDVAIRPQPEGAFLAALTAQSYLSGRSVVLNYQSQPITPNLYSLFLAPSGQGKDASRRVLRAIAEAYNDKETPPDTFASVQALQNYVSRVKKTIWLHDEFGRDLSVMCGQQNNANVSGIITEALKLYSSAHVRRYLPKLIAQEAKGTRRPEPVDRPSLTVFATGNPREFFDAANEAVLRNGYIARFTTVTGRSYSPKKETSYEEAVGADPFKLSARLVSRIRQWRDFEVATDTSDPVVVKFDREAFDAIRSFDSDVEAEVKADVEGSDGIAEVKARFFEKAWKYALLLAVSKFGPTPSAHVDRDCAELAVELVSYENKQFTANRDRFAQTVLSKLALDVREWAQERGGEFTRSEFTRRFQRASLREREETLETLIDSDYLISLEPEAGKKARYYRLIQ